MQGREGQGRTGQGEGRVDKNGGKNHREHACVNAAARRLRTHRRVDITRRGIVAMPICVGYPLVTCQATDNRTASTALLNNISLVVANGLTQFAITADYANRGRIQIPICNRTLMRLDTYSRVIQLIRIQERYDSRRTYK